MATRNTQTARAVVTAGTPSTARTTQVARGVVATVVIPTNAMVTQVARSIVVAILPSGPPLELMPTPILTSHRGVHGIGRRL